MLANYFAVFPRFWFLPSSLGSLVVLCISLFNLNSFPIFVISSSTWFFLRLANFRHTWTKWARIRQGSKLFYVSFSRFSVLSILFTHARYSHSYFWLDKFQTPASEFRPVTSSLISRRRRRGRRRRPRPSARATCTGGKFFITHQFETKLCRNISFVI